MRIVVRQAEMAALARRWQLNGESVGFVPTMGALHEGHASLIRRARKENRRVVVSIFVNPKQFGPNEDYSRYPRTFPADAKLCKDSGADVVYHPDVEQVYPPGFTTFVEVPGLQEPLCGRFRPGHFRGVATVVLKLLETTRPTRAYFGEKDWQQLAIIRRMALDLDLGATIVGCPIVRERDGLALSSRNVYLHPNERQAAPVIYRALTLAQALLKAGKGQKAALARGVREITSLIPDAMIDYFSLVDAESLTPPKRGQTRGLRLLAAVRVGKTRLIDNVPASL